MDDDSEPTTQERRFVTKLVKDFGGLLKYLQTTDGHKGWIFRGHSDSSWTLLPSLFRGHCNANPAGIAQRHLEKFKIYARGRIPNTDGWANVRYWSLGRHYGLRTPLLDWSASPFIALFFAFCDEHASNNDGALYALNASYVNRIFCQKIGDTFLQDDSLLQTFNKRYDLFNVDDTTKSIMLGRAILDTYDSDVLHMDDESRKIQDVIGDKLFRLLSPKAGDNPRLLNQRGLFTYNPNIEPIEQMIESYGNEPKTALLKIIIPRGIRTKVLRFLNNMNINYLSLFPDLEGASKYCNEKLLEEVTADLTDLNINRIWV